MGARSTAAVVAPTDDNERSRFAPPAPCAAAERSTLAGRRTPRLEPRHRRRWTARWRRRSRGSGRRSYLLPPLARGPALLRRHALPALPVLHQLLPLLRRHRFELAHAIEDPLAPLRRQLLEPVIGVLQLLPSRLRQLVPALEIVQDAVALLGRHALEAPQVLARRVPLLGRHRFPVPVVLEHLLALRRSEPLPAVEVALDHGALVRRQPLEIRRRRGLAPGLSDDGERQQHDRRRQRAQVHRWRSWLAAVHVASRDPASREATENANASRTTATRPTNQDVRMLNPPAIPSAGRADG